jgi:hypothetical protein
VVDHHHGDRPTNPSGGGREPRTTALDTDAGSLMPYRAATAARSSWVTVMIQLGRPLQHGQVSGSGAPGYMGVFMYRQMLESGRLVSAHESP